MTVKVTTLTYFNTAALREAIEAGLLEDVVVTATTATFAGEDGDLIADAVQAAKRQMGRQNEHPAKSLSAVIRKLRRAPGTILSTVATPSTSIIVTPETPEPQFMRVEAEPTLF